ncbi:hypothetical protein ACTGX8_05995 [Streptococcus suis]
MFEDMRDVFTKVIELAREKRGVQDTTKDFTIESMKNSPYFIARKKLTDYLDSLSYDQVKIVQTVMYVGRDTSYEMTNINPEDLYEEVFNSLTWHEDKSIEISQIAQKSPLDDYLIRGMELLKI